MTKPLQPAIRFKGFTDAWEQRKLGELITEYKKIVDSDCTLPVLTSSKTEGVVLQEEHFGSKQLHDIKGYNILPRNFCTYRNRSDGVDFTFNINKCCDKGIISKFYPVFYGNNSNIFFISLVLNYSPEVVKEIAYTCIGTGQKVLSFLDLKNINLRVPSEKEQNKTATYFDSLDHRITLHQRKLDQLNELKRTLLQKMFPKKDEKIPEYRFPGFTDDWEQRKLGEIAEIVMGQSPDSKNYTDNPSHHILVQGNADIKNGEVVPRVWTTEITKQAEPGDIILTVRAPVGSVSKTSFSIVIGRGVAAIKGDDFIYHKLIYLKEFGYWTKYSTGSTFDSINSKDIKDTEITEPESSERKKISNILNFIDKAITLHQRKLELLQDLKKTLLQRLFV